MLGRGSVPIVKDLVLVGGGHSHVAVLKSFGMRPMPGVQVTLVSPDALTPYSGMLPGLMAGHYSVEEAHVDLLRLARFAGADFIRASIESVDPEKRLVTIPGRPDLRFDILSINTGSTPMTGDVPGASTFALPVKPVRKFLDQWAHYEQKWKNTGQSPLIAIVGGGAGGVELTLSLEYRLNKLLQLHPRARFCLFHSGREILGSHNHRVRQIMHQILTRRGIQVHLNAPVAEVMQGAIRTEDGREFETDLVIWVTHASAPEWISQCGVAVDESGFLALGSNLASVSHPHIFGAGDSASVRSHPRPKSGVFAVRQGPPLARNIRLALLGESPKKFRPQKQFLSLISTGNQYAIASRGPLALHGKWVWKWKDHIDRQWMRGYSELPEMNHESAMGLPDSRLTDASTMKAIAAHPMRCTGCGAKVGATVLRQALEHLRMRSIEMGTHRHPAFNAPEDAVLLKIPSGRQGVQSLDFFPCFVNDPYLFGRLVTVHAMSDIFAMGGVVHSALVNAVIPWYPNRRQEQVLVQFLSGVLVELERHGADLLGGHTSEGSSLAAGLVLNGSHEKGQALKKGPLSAGLQLYLTKPLGTGLVLAGEMRGMVPGQSVHKAYEWMLQDNSRAGLVAQQLGAVAVTDVTGFGLIGHLAEMMGDSGVGVDLDMDALIPMPGALDVASAGISSSLEPANRELGSIIHNLSEWNAHPSTPLLFDPQTSGGLLVGIDKSMESEFCQAMERAGVPGCHRIGSTHNREAGIMLTGKIKEVF